MSIIKNVFFVAGIAIASGATLTDEASAKMSNAFNSLTSALATENRSQVTTKYADNGSGDCFIVNKVGNSTMSYPVPCNK